MKTSKTITLNISEKHAILRLSPRGAGFAAVLLLAICGIGCGDQFRPIALPITAPQPTNATAHVVASVSANGGLDPGAVSRLNVSGDTISSIFSTGVAPVHAAFLPNGIKIYVANSGEDSVSASSTISTTTGTATHATTISLPQLCSAGGCAASHPVFVATTEAGKMYVANSANGTVAVINTSTDAVVASVAVDPAFAGNPLPSPNPAAQPVALAELPNGQKIYSVNQGNNTVTSISTVDDTVLATIPIGAPPIWAVAGSDNADVYVLDKNGTISVIDTLADAVVATTSVGAGANFLLFDSIGTRLYATNPVTATVNVFDVSDRVLTPHAGSPLAIAVAPGSPCTSAPMPMSVTVLGDDSKAYVASVQADASGTICTQATVVNTGTGNVTAAIPLSVSTDMSSQTGCNTARFRVFAASSGGGTNSPFRVYISQCDAGSVAVIDTAASTTGSDQHAADVLGATLPAPLSSFPPLTGQTNPPSQNPVFVVSGQ